MDRLTRLAKRKTRGCLYTSDRDELSVIQRLAYYEDLREQGRLVELPCKVGDRVYTPFGNAIVRELGVDIVTIGAGGRVRFNTTNGYWWEEDTLGEAVFLTRAEAALKGKDHDGEER